MGPTMFIVQKTYLLKTPQNPQTNRKKNPKTTNQKLNPTKPHKSLEGYNNNEMALYDHAQPICMLMAQRSDEKI